jgi:hypothetical protein
MCNLAHQLLDCAVMVNSQLWNEYQGALATRDARFMARWRRSLTSHDRARLDRMIAEDAERAAHQADMLTASAPAMSRPAPVNRPVVPVWDRDVMSPAMVQAHLASAETEARLRALSRESGRSLDRLRRELRAHLATRALPPCWSVGSFCAMVQRERRRQPGSPVTHPFLPADPDDLVTPPS